MWGLPGTVVAADALGGVGEALQGDAAAQLQTLPPVGKVKGFACSPHDTHYAIRL